MQCWICKRQAQGYNHADIRFEATDPRHHPSDWVFCSRCCLERFNTLYHRWLNVHNGRLDASEVIMIDPTDVERAALRQSMKSLGEVAGAVGFDKPLGHYTEAEALQVVTAIVSGYIEAMGAHHAATRYPPVRGAPTPHDPLLADEIPF